MQIRGEAVWRQIRGSDALRQRIEQADAVRAQAAFGREKNGYYLERYDELMDRGLLPVARAVADAFEERSLLNVPAVWTGGKVVALLRDRIGYRTARPALRRRS